MSAQAPPLLQVVDLRKSFANTPALRGVSFSVRPGEFVGFLGPNGAGKSTTIKILAGVYGADTGRVLLAGQEVRSLAGRRDVGFIHQDLGLVDVLSILDNMRLGVRLPLRSRFPLDRRAERGPVIRALKHVGLAVDVDTPVGELLPAERALVAVARVLSHGAELLIVDEATSTLPPDASDRLVSTLRDLAQHGAGVIFVSHKLSEVRRYAERAIVLVDGQVAADTAVDADDADQLSATMLTTTAATEAQAVAGSGQSVGRGERVLLRMQGVHRDALGPIDLEVHSGEVVGLTGLVGSGLHEVGLLAAGHLRPDRGTIDVDGSVGLVPPQRETQGSIADLTVGANLTLSALGRFARGIGLIRGREERTAARESAKRLNVSPPDPAATMGVLSGGNQQKVLFGRALMREPALLVLCEPTRGVDVSTRREIYELIRRTAREGAAVLIVSSDVEDLLAVCSRVGHVDHGVVPHLWDRAEVGDDALANLV